MSEFTIDDSQQKCLLAIARNRIEHELGGADLLPLPEDGVFGKRSGVFVSVSVRRRLRGCIGTIEGERQLANEISNMAKAAAFTDPRFNSIQTEDLDDLSIEISVLSPLRSVSGAEDIRIGDDGLVIERGDQRGLLLPQVAAERGWDAETFLGYTCDKAGLDADAWRDPDTEIFAFTAIIFAD